MSNKVKRDTFVEKYFIIIPTHNRKEILCNTLETVCEQLHGCNAQVIVVDAGSSDGTRECVKQSFPSVDVVRGKAEMWWAATVNHGLDALTDIARTGDKVILMNDDVFFKSNTFSCLMEASKLRPAAVIGALNLTDCRKDSNRVYFAGGHYDFLIARHKANIPAGNNWIRGDKRFLDTDFLYGRLLVIPWDIFGQGYRFDHVSFPQYCADEDFTYAAKLNGVEVVVDTHSIVFVNEETTAHFSMNFANSGLRGIVCALISFNSPYNFRQAWIFSRKYAKFPVVYIFMRYFIMFVNENFRKRIKSGNIK